MYLNNVFFYQYCNTVINKLSGSESEVISQMVTGTDMKAVVVEGTEDEKTEELERCLVASVFTAE